MKIKFSIFVVFLLSISLIATPLHGQKKKVKEISVSEIHQMMDEKDFTLVNVHIPYYGEIPQTDLFIPFNKIKNNLDKLPEKDQKIVLYCRSGRMSKIVSKKLAKKGYTNIYNLEGGMKAWKAAGYELPDRKDEIYR